MARRYFNTYDVREVSKVIGQLAEANTAVAFKMLASRGAASGSTTRVIGTFEYAVPEGENLYPHAAAAGSLADHPALGDFLAARDEYRKQCQEEALQAHVRED